MSQYLRPLTIACAVGSAVAAGAFFTFSTFTIGGLKRLPPAQGAAAMQSINKQAPTPLFMLLLFGTGLACTVLGIHAALHLDQPHAKQRLAGCGIYLLGVVVLTVGYHVPLNDKLASFDPNSAAGIKYWSTYLDQWVPMNHIRTLAPIATAILLTMSLEPT